MEENRTVWRDPFSVELERRRAHIESLEGDKLKADFDSLNLSVFILSGNGNELLNSAASFAGTDVHVDQLPKCFPDEFSRLLHNLLASAKSLMEVQRSIGNRWWGKNSDFMTKDQREAVAKFYVAGEPEFLFKLRDFALHIGSPNLSIKTVMSLKKGGPLTQENSIKLKKGELLDWSGWNTASRKFIESQDVEFGIFDVIERYFKSVTDYHFWFWSRLENDFQALIDEHKEKAKELFFWVEEFSAVPDWLHEGDGFPPPGWSPRRFRAEKTQARYAYGSRGFRIITVDTQGIGVVGDSEGWSPLPRKADKIRAE